MVITKISRDYALRTDLLNIDVEVNRHNKVFKAFATFVYVTYSCLLN